jgi:N-acetylglucosaminyldiphosphoundecaprenol N-acetyl-beta-D-mannosaminyltransferase
MTNHFNLKNKIKIFGWLKNIYPILRRSDIFVLSSKAEGFSYAIIEAMSQGLPIISTNTPHGPSEILDGGKFGILVPMSDPISLSRAFVKLTHDKSLYGYFSEQSLKRSAYFSREKMTSSYKETFAKMASRNSEKMFDKSFIPSVNRGPVKKGNSRIQLFDEVPFDKVTKNELILKVIEWASCHTKKVVLNMNTYGAVTYMQNKKYAKAIRSADLIYADGWGPVFASRFQATSLPERVNVGDFIDNILVKMHRKKLKLFLLGSKADLIVKTVSKIKSKYKDIKIVGSHHGFFPRKDQGEIALKITKARPNLVLVGMGLPIQEYFIHDNWKKLPNAVFMGVGSVFEYIAGKNRAPIWMRKSGLEWLFRLIQEPRRLWKRYTLKNLEFIYYFLKSFRISDSKNPGSS